MNYWIVAGLKKIKVLKPFHFKFKRPLRKYISIDPTWGKINFFYGAIHLMKLVEGERINFVFIDDMIFLYKNFEGVRIRKALKEMLRTQSRPMGRYVKEAAIAAKIGAKRTIRCELQETGSEFNGNVLYHVKFPSRISKEFKKINSKTNY